MKKEIVNFIKESVDWLQREQQGCCRYKLDDRLAIFVGWSAGYGDEKRDDVIQAKDNLDFGINVGIKVWTSDDMWTDFDWLNFPYYNNGDVEDMSLAVAPNENYETLTNSLLEWYEDIKGLEISRNGEILSHRCKYCGEITNGTDENVLCEDCRMTFGHAFYSEL